MFVRIQDAYTMGPIPYGFEAVLFDATGQRIAKIWERYGDTLDAEIARHWPNVPILSDARPVESTIIEGGQ